jgi:hypothetical protein
MERFNCRSPYIITIDDDVDQIASRMEIEIKDQTNTLVNTYEISKTMFSPTQTANYYNISPYAYDYLNSVDADMFGCIIFIKTYYTLSTKEEIGSTSYNLIATNGYSDYLEPNYNDNNDIFILQKQFTKGLNYKRKGETDITNSPTIDVIVDTNFITDLSVKYSNDGANEVIETYTPTGNIEFYRINLTNIDSNFSQYNTFDIFCYGFSYYQIQLNNLCEPKYNVNTLRFINRYGSLQYLTLFKNSTQTLEVKSSDYNTNTFTTYPNYNTDLGQKRIFNKNGSYTIKCNTGWVYEIDNDDIQDVMLSENLLLTYFDNGVEKTNAVTLKNTSQLMKNSVTDKMINYEFEFEIASSVINNVV